MNNFDNCPRELPLGGEPLKQDIVMYLLVIMINPRKQYTHIAWIDKDKWLNWIMGVRFIYRPMWKSNQTLRIKSVTNRKYSLWLLVLTIPLGPSYRKCAIMGWSHCGSLTEWIQWRYMHILFTSIQHTGLSQRVLLRSRVLQVTNASILTFQTLIFKLNNDRTNRRIVNQLFKQITYTVSINA